VVSSDRQQISSGKDLVGIVNKNKYNYYEINIRKDVCTLLITLTPFDFGDAEVLVSYNPHKIPIHNSHHNFNSMSRHRAHMLEINFKDLFLKPQMQGIWIIGVYGKAEETRYSLSVTYETIKKLVLPLEQSLDMYVNPNASIYVEYTHSSEDSFYIRIDKQSGDVQAYIRAIKEGEFYVNVLPNATNSNWKFSSQYATWIKIDKSDPGFCSKCTYLIGIEAAQASKIVMSAYLDFHRFRIESSLSYAESLKPQQTVKYVIFPESYFNVDLISGQISFYFIEEDAKDNKNFKKYSLSVSNTINSMLLRYHFKSGYVIFENTGTEPANFTFASESKQMPTFLVLERYHHTVLSSYNTKPFVYYNSFKNETILLTARFCFEEPIDHFSMFTSTSKSPTSLKLKRLLLSVKFWGNLVSSGLSHADNPDGDFMVDYFEDFPQKKTRKVCAVQTNTIYGQEGAGRYELSLFNPYHYDLNASLYIHTSKTSLSTYHKNEAYFEALDNQKKSIHDIHLLKQESWYYNILVCSGGIQLSFANNTNALETKPLQVEQLKPGQSFIYTTLSPNFESIYTQLESLEKSSNYLVRSTRFHEEEVIRYENLPQPDSLSYEFTYAEDDSSLKVLINPIVWKVTSKPEQVLYRVKVCPAGPHSPMEDYCKVGKDCHFVSYSGFANDKGLISVGFPDVALGDYTVSVLVSVAHNGATVYSFVYPTLEVSLVIPLIKKYSNVMIYVGCGLLASLMMFFVYKKVRGLDTVKRWMDEYPTQKYGYIIDEPAD